jgi:RNA polymerase sigma factor (sigma-70 family)
MVDRKLGRLLALAERLLGRRSEAEEVAQEAFVRLWKQAPTWQPGRARFDTWLHRVALNLCYDRLRRRRDEAAGDDGEEVAADPAGDPDALLESRQRDRRVARALAELPSASARRSSCSTTRSLSNGEAAELMGIGIEALESLLARGAPQPAQPGSRPATRRHDDALNGSSPCSTPSAPTCAAGPRPSATRRARFLADAPARVRARSRRGGSARSRARCRRDRRARRAADRANRCRGRRGRRARRRARSWWRAPASGRARAGRSPARPGAFAGALVVSVALGDATPRAAADWQKRATAFSDRAADWSEE